MALSSAGLSTAGISFCNTTIGSTDTTSANHRSSTNTNPPLIRVAKGNFARPTCTTGTVGTASAATILVFLPEQPDLLSARAELRNALAARDSARAPVGGQGLTHET